MSSIMLFIRRAAACVLFCRAGSAGDQHIGSKYAEANGVRLHYLVTGHWLMEEAMEGASRNWSTS